MSALDVLMKAGGDDPLRHAGFHLLLSHPAVCDVSEEKRRAFLLEYFEDGFLGRHRGPREEGPYALGHIFSAWLRDAWPESDVAAEQAKEMLARVIRTGAHQSREIVLLGVLEHLFEEEAFLSLFEDWKDDPALSSTYEEARDLAGS